MNHPIRLLSFYFIATPILLSISACTQSKKAISDIKICLAEVVKDFSPPKEPANDPVLAHVGEEVIRVSDLQARLRELPTKNQEFFTTSGYKTVLLQRQITAHIMAQKARSLGLDQDAEFQADKKINEQTLLVRRYGRFILNPESPETIQKARAYYDHHSELYGPRVVFDASFIHFKSRGEAEKAQALLKKGRSFDAVAKLFTPPTLSFKLPPFSASPKNTYLEKILVPFHDGKVSPIIELPTGDFYIVKKEGHRDVPTTPFEEVKDQILKQLYRDAVFALRERTAITIDSKTVDAVILSTISIQDLP